MKMALIDKGTAAVAGGVWVALTVGFEIILGRYVMGLSWIRVLEDYNIRDGGLMVLGLLALYAAPFIALWYRRRNETNVIADGQSRA